MSGSFLDSNVLVYLLDEKDETKRQKAETLVSQLMANREGVISYQVVQETLNVATGKLEPPVAPKDAIDLLDRLLLPLWNTMPTAALYRRALETQDRFGYGFYDSLIIAAALEAGCSRLYSEDLHDGQRIGSLSIENPFRE